MNDHRIVYAEHDGIRVFHFNRPEVLNCIGRVTHEELVDAWKRFKEDNEALLTIVTSTGYKAIGYGVCYNRGSLLV